jgi:anti-sigma regulatory factor (Ser/Thr protein kinase)
VLTSQHLLRFAGTLEGFNEAALALRQLVDQQGLEDGVRYNVELVFEEVATNIVRHGKPRGDVALGVSFDDDVVLTFEDDGIAFDPRERPAPLVPDSIEEAEIGGLGLVLVRKICRRIDYERTSQHRNRLTVVIPAR